mmetsp:Transcript_40429/g.116223  ORF Transcript_40429/g.116223 Transcript_40429/m.116223 type:complete len:246 (-) Transcript_40429:370-1107(-)
MPTTQERGCCACRSTAWTSTLEGAAATRCTGIGSSALCRSTRGSRSGTRRRCGRPTASSTPRVGGSLTSSATMASWSQTSTSRRRRALPSACSCDPGTGSTSSATCCRWHPWTTERPSSTAAVSPTATSPRPLAKAGLGPETCSRWPVGSRRAWPSRWQATGTQPRDPGALVATQTHMRNRRRRTTRTSPRRRRLWLGPRSAPFRRPPTSPAGGCPRCSRARLSVPSATTPPAAGGRRRSSTSWK